jgi:1,2-diacylglycerol 3-beta-glucosyltransferase
VPAGALSLVAALGTGHLLLLLAASLSARRRAGAPTARDRRAGDGGPAGVEGGAAPLGLAVVIPAHDEEDQLATTLRSILACPYDLGPRRVVVVADNCSDRTAEVARAEGAEVLERHDLDRRGKGYALAWAFEQVLADPRIDAVCVIDADCGVTGNLLCALAARLGAGADAVQAAYLFDRPEASTGAALRWAGFALFNVVRPMGRDWLGLSAGLLGTGMAFSRDLLTRSPWRAFSYAEDREQHLRWVLDGVRVAFVSNAEVRSVPPLTAAGRDVQERRWESGRIALAASFTPRLLARALACHDLVALDAGLEPLLPSQSLLLALSLAGLVAGAAAGDSRLPALGAAATLGQMIYVIGGLMSVGAPAPVWRALLHGPAFVTRRVRLLIGQAARGGPSEWERTPRSADVA